MRSNCFFFSLPFLGVYIVWRIFDSTKKMRKRCFTFKYIRIFFLFFFCVTAYLAFIQFSWCDGNKKVFPFLYTHLFFFHSFYLILIYCGINWSLSCVLTDRHWIIVVWIVTVIQSLYNFFLLAMHFDTGKKKRKISRTKTERTKIFIGFWFGELNSRQKSIQSLKPKNFPHIFT